MLITGLLISGGASAVLISEWSDAVRVTQINDRAAADQDDVSAVSYTHLTLPTKA